MQVPLPQSTNDTRFYRVRVQWPCASSPASGFELDTLDLKAAGPGLVEGFTVSNTDRSVAARRGEERPKVAFDARLEIKGLFDRIVASAREAEQEGIRGHSAGVP